MRFKEGYKMVTGKSRLGSELGSGFGAIFLRVGGLVIFLVPYKICFIHLKTIFKITNQLLCEEVTFNQFFKGSFR